MNCKIHIHLLNELYSQELANEKYGGKESADNLRYEWEDELEITTTVLKVLEKENSTYTLSGYDETMHFSLTISNKCTYLKFIPRTVQCSMWVHPNVS